MARKKMKRKSTKEKVRRSSSRKDKEGLYLMLLVGAVALVALIVMVSKGGLLSGDLAGNAFNVQGPKTINCSESDAGLEPEEYGRIEGTYIDNSKYTFFDECKDADVLIEYVCKGNKAKAQPIPCTNSSCSSGECTQ